MDQGVLLTTEIRRGEVGDIATVAATLADGFYADPIWGWVFDDDQHRREQHQAWFGIVAAQAVDNLGAWMTAGGEAAALWVPPGALELSSEREAELAAALRASCGPRAEFVLAMFELFDANHPHDVEHAYLSLLATADAHRGRGIGMDLLRANLAELDRDGVPAYLESSNPANLDRYRSVGFEAVGGFDLPDGPRVTTMWRPPQG